MKTLKNLLISNGLIVMLIGLICGLYFFIFNTIGLDFKYFPGDFGDGRLNLLFLEHAHKFFTGKLITPYWDIPFMFPEKNVLAYSDNLIGSAPIYSFFRFLNYNEYSAYQAWFITVSGLNYISAFYLLKYLFKNNYTSVIGAYIFAFSLAIYSQIGHAQTFPRYAIPLAILFAYKFSNSLKIKHLFLTLFFVVYEIYCAVYLGFMLAIPIGIFLFLVFVKEKKLGTKFEKKWIINSSIIVIINLILLLPIMLPYTERRNTPSFGHLSHIIGNIPTLKSYFFSRNGSLIWNSLSKVPEGLPKWWNHQIFAGGIATIGSIATIIYLFIKKRKEKLKLRNFNHIELLVLTGLFTFLFYLRFSEITAYVFIYFLPGFSSMRALQRIINVELIFFSISSAFLLSKLFTKKPFVNIILFLFLLIITIGDNYFKPKKINRFEIEDAIERTARLDSLFNQIPEKSVVSVELSQDINHIAYTQIDAMLMGQKHNLKVINGYTATSPRNYHHYWRTPNEKSRNIWLKEKEAKIDQLYIVNKLNNEIKIVNTDFSKSE